VAPAHKGQGSVLQGIQNVQAQWISVTKRSINIIKEYRNYVWITDKDGRILNEPVDIYNHAMDAGRYAMEDLRPRKPQAIAAPAVQGGIQPYYPELGI
jgi:phage terminase large subunit